MKKRLVLNTSAKNANNIKSSWSQSCISFNEFSNVAIVIQYWKNKYHNKQAFFVKNWSKLLELLSIKFMSFSKIILLERNTDYSVSYTHLTLPTNREV